MRPTIRAVGLAALVVLAVGMAFTAGTRALNAVAAPALAALAIGAAQLWTAEEPTVTRRDPAAGFPGETRTVELTVDGGGVARLRDSIPQGLDPATDELRASLPATVGYEVELGERGEWTLGPARLVVTDVLGAFVETVEPDGTATVLVYPRVVDLRGAAAFAGLFQRGAATERQAFAAVREYEPGDPLRDVHWKTSAKRPGDDLVVRQFDGSEDEDDRVVIAAAAAEGRADEMASAAASVALLALEAGASVGITCPAGSVPAGRGADHRRRLLELLARTGPGRLDEGTHEDSAVIVDARADGQVRVSVDGRTHALDLDSGALESIDSEGVRA
ncbi:MAG: DUF58 domain-containing protein [Haloarculaceae archaeon]